MDWKHFPSNLFSRSLKLKRNLICSFFRYNIYSNCPLGIIIFYVSILTSLSISFSIVDFLIITINKFYMIMLCIYLFINFIFRIIAITQYSIKHFSILFIIFIKNSMYVFRLGSLFAYDYEVCLFVRCISYFSLFCFIYQQKVFFEVQ